MFKPCMLPMMSSARAVIAAVQPELKAKLSDSRYNIAMENHEFGVAPEAFTKWIALNDTYDILSTSKDRSVLPVLLLRDC